MLVNARERARERLAEEVRAKAGTARFGVSDSGRFSTRGGMKASVHANICVLNSNTTKTRENAASQQGGDHAGC